MKTFLQLQLDQEDSETLVYSLRESNQEFELWPPSMPSESSKWGTRFNSQWLPVPLNLLITSNKSFFWAARELRARVIYIYISIPGSLYTVSESGPGNKVNHLPLCGIGGDKLNLIVDQLGRTNASFQLLCCLTVSKFGSSEPKHRQVTDKRTFLSLTLRVEGRSVNG